MVGQMFGRTFLIVCLYISLNLNSIFVLLFTNYCLNFHCLHFNYIHDYTRHFCWQYSAGELYIVCTLWVVMADWEQYMGTIYARSSVMTSLFHCFIWLTSWFLRHCDYVSDIITAVSVWFSTCFAHIAANTHVGLDLELNGTDEIASCFISLRKPT